MGFTILGKSFATVTILNPTIEVVIFHFCGWCTLGVFLFLAFTRLRHDCQGLLSPCNGMHVCTDKTSVYTLIRKRLGGMESEPMELQGKNPLYGKNSPQRRIKPKPLHQAGQRAQHTTDELFQPQEANKYHELLYMCVLAASRKSCLLE